MNITISNHQANIEYQRENVFNESLGIIIYVNYSLYFCD